MVATMKRREFVRGSLLAAGALLAGTSTARAAGGFMAYGDVNPALFQGINRMKDPQHPTGLEELHVPVIEVPGRIVANEAFAVKVKVGEKLHPMSVQHHIQFVELFAGNEPAGRSAFSPIVGVPEATFWLKLDKPVTLVVRDYCNLHGLWEGRKVLTLS